MRLVILVLMVLIATASPSRADEKPRQSLCLMLESAASANRLPLAFLVHIIWRESRFDPDAVGPKTRSGARAEGIAQFMPGTAAERDLADPYDPVQALPKAAAYLASLRDEFGNLGLAAAAYNAGPRRVREWMAGTGPMPAQTRAYVAAVTGHDIEQWKDAKDGVRDPKPTDCRTLIALLRREPNAFVTALEQRVRTEASHPWGVQLAASFSRERALTAYGRTMTRFATALRDRDPIIQRRLLRSRGTRPMYQVRIGADTRVEAERLCGRLRAAGGACLVLRNSGRS